MKKKEPFIIGSVDKLDLPEFGLLNIGSRIDTGAALCAIHCHHVQVTSINGSDYISFMLLDPSHPEYQEKIFRTSHFIEKKVKSSFGDVQFRFAIETQIVAFGRTFEAEITLADRESMQYPLLIGRNLLRQGFLVNIRKRNMSWKKKQP